MTGAKQRLTVTVDPDLVEAATRAVAAGEAESMSAWVSAAIAAKVAQDQRLERLAEAIAEYEAQFGEITEEEIRRQQRKDREEAIVVRGRRSS